jgi:UDP-GlcNAc:undecaprenyl-phosphate GlcNAc-1-phosphate transferase
LSTAILIFAATVFASAFSHAIAKFLVRHAVLPDVPNGRSSHRRSTPRSGGLAIFGGFTAAFALVLAFAAISGAPTHFAPLAALGFLAFAFGAVDDLRGIGALRKLIAQIALAAAFVAIYGGVDRIPAPFIGDLDIGVAGFALTMFWIVAFMNAFNFMDGVNGIAGGYGVLALAAIGAASAATGAATGVPAVLLAAALFGFLPLNFPGGKIFMGDCGSQFAGFMIATFAVLASKGGAGLSPFFVPIVFMPFIVDVALTLVMRARRGCNILKAHNEHIYQLLARMGRTHQSVTTIYLSLGAVSAAVAIAVNGASPLTQYAAILSLVSLFAVLGFAVYARADKAGLFAMSPDCAGGKDSDDCAGQEQGVSIAAE